MVVIQRSMRDPSSRTWIRLWSNATFIDGERRFPLSCVTKQHAEHGFVIIRVT